MNPHCRGGDFSFTFALTSDNRSLNARDNRPFQIQKPCSEQTVRVARFGAVE